MFQYYYLLGHYILGVKNKMHPTNQALYTRRPTPVPIIIKYKFIKLSCHCQSLLYETAYDRNTNRAQRCETMPTVIFPWSAASATVHRQHDPGANGEIILHSYSDHTQ